MRFSLFPVFLLVAAGCGRFPPPAHPITHADEALDSRRLAVLPLEAFRAEARIDQREGGRRIRGTVLMIIERPDRVRIDAMTRLGPAATLTSDGERFALLDLRASRFFAGGSCASNVARGLGVAIEPAELVRLLVGDTPRFAGGSATIEPKRGGYRIVIAADDGGRQVIELGLPAEDLDAAPEAQRPRLESSTVYDASGKRRLKVTFGAHRPVRVGDETLSLPHEIRLVEAAEGSDILLRYKSIEPLDEVPEGAFDQIAPAGLAVEHLPCNP